MRRRRRERERERREREREEEEEEEEGGGRGAREGSDCQMGPTNRPYFLAVLKLATAGQRFMVLLIEVNAGGEREREIERERVKIGPIRRNRNLTARVYTSPFLLLMSLGAFTLPLDANDFRGAFFLP